MFFEKCKDCDGECIGSIICAPEGYAVCCACQRPGCLLTLEEFQNLNEDCKKRRIKAGEMLEEFNRENFGETEGRA